MWIDVVVGVVTGGILVISGLAWAGVLRSWAYGYEGMAVITFVPALAFCAFVFTLREVLPALLTLVLLLVGLVAVPVSLFLYGWRPAWFAPRWVKDNWRYRGQTGWN